MYEKDPATVQATEEGSTISVSRTSDLKELEGNDEVLAAKMRLINNAIDEIGFTPYHLKLFFLNGMGYATDSQITTIENSVRTYINYQFGYKFAVSNEVSYGGLFVGCIFWGFSADLIGRKLAFNLSLILLAIFCILTGAMNSMATFCIFIGLLGFAAGGNLVLDTCVFLEWLPHKNQWLLTFFAFFWSIGQTVAVLLAWAFLPNNSCDSESYCPSHINKGWRYTYYVNGAIVLVMAILRITVIRLKETPKFLVSNNRDSEAVEVLQSVANKYNRKCSLTVEQLTECGEIEINDDVRKHVSLSGIQKIVKEHLKLLFANRKSSRSIILLFLSWFLLGIVYPLYSSFLPVYLATRGANISASTTYGVYRDNVISNVVSAGGPCIAGLLLYWFPRLGRRGVLAIGGLSTMAFLLGYTAITNRASNIALSSLSFAALYIYYGCLYAYSPEVLPSAARGTGNALCFAFTRFAGMITPIISWFANPDTAVPIYICAVAVGLIGLMALLFPFEPSKHRVV